MTIPDALLTRLISCTEDVFERMVFMPITLGTVDGHVSPGPHAHVVATIAFAGHRNGFISFHSSVECAQHIAGAMLGLPLVSVLLVTLFLQSDGLPLMPLVIVAVVVSYVVSAHLTPAPKAAAESVPAAA